MYYPFDLAPSFWEQLEEKLKDGSVVLLDMVKNEITEGHDELSNWMKSLQGINIIDHRTPEIIEKYSRVLGAVQSNTCYKQSALAEWSRESVADPWLIATAAVRKLTIVTKCCRRTTFVGRMDSVPERKQTEFRRTETGSYYYSKLHGKYF